uniref:Uncharacterized protein n=1 Tax=Rhizophora mucronata TaxID=61149 RepID=A0A2P2PUY7_RHIMU
MGNLPTLIFFFPLMCMLSFQLEKMNSKLDYYFVGISVLKT